MASKTKEQHKAVVVGTWPFSQVPAMAAVAKLKSGSAMDAVEYGINVAEEDPSYGKYHVGCGGWRNANNTLELDAAIMDGKTMEFGAVTALQGYTKPISVSRKVLEKSRHSMLTGAGAAEFAETQGFQRHQNLGACKIKDGGTDHKNSGHDTLGLLVLDKNGNLCAGVSTSGAAFKEAGRVGDSALPGCGLYADNESGAACCSGDGDEIMKYCPSYRVVSLMKEGLIPSEACEKVVKDIEHRRPKGDKKKEFEMVIIALNKEGDFGSANMGVRRCVDEDTGYTYDGFPYVVVDENMDQPKMYTVAPILS